MKQLLQACLHVLNRTPNFPINVAGFDRSYQLAEAVDKALTTGPDWEAFGREIMKDWPDSAPDMFEIQDIAEKHRLVRKVEYDPEKDEGYGAAEWDVEPGDPWFLLNFKKA